MDPDTPTGNMRRLLRALVYNLLNEGEGCLSAQEDTALELAILEEDYANSHSIPSSGVALDGLASQFSVDMSKAVDEPVVRKLAKLATAPNNIHLIAEIKEIFEVLVRLLSDRSGTAIQGHAARALKNLAMHSSASDIIGRLPTALPQLVRLLQADVGMDLKGHALEALENLSALPENQLRISRTRDAVTCLADLLSIHSLFRERAAVILSNLRLGVEEKFRIVRRPGVLAGLVHLLYLDTNLPVQIFAAKALLSLAFKEESFRTVATLPGVLAAAMHLLCVNTDQLLQKFAAGILILLKTDEEHGFTIADFPGALQGLVGMLQKTENERLQMAAATLLKILAREKETRLAIILCPGALEGLVRLLESSDRLKISAVEMLGNMLAPETSAIILGFRGIQQGLVDLLFRIDNSALQTLGAEVLGDFSSTLELGHFIATFPRTLEGLEALLHNHLSPEGQQQGARTIAYLAESDNSGVVSAMLPRILPSLAGLLNNPTAQEHALKALTYLAGPSSNKIMISEHQVAVKGIVRLLFEEGEQGGTLREQATKALEKLYEL